jgi:hypothetical protein
MRIDVIFLTTRIFFKTINLIIVLESPMMIKKCILESISMCIPYRRAYSSNWLLVELHKP